MEHIYISSFTLNNLSKILTFHALIFNFISSEASINFFLVLIPNIYIMILLRQVPFIYLFTHILINTWETIVCKDHTKLLRSPPPQVSHSASPSSQTPLHPEPGTWLELVWLWTRVLVDSWSQHVSLS